jgi:hypothetical protein
MRDIPQPSNAREDEDGGSPCPEDGDFFDARPDAEETEKAISKFISGLECEEQSCFESLHTLLSKLPVPVATTTGSNMSHAAALDGGFLPTMDAEQQKRFTPSELILYKHAVEYRSMYITYLYISYLHTYVQCMSAFIHEHNLYVHVYTCIYMLYTCIYMYIHV